MKVVFLLSKWPVYGGIETVTRTLANEFVNRGYNIYIVYTEYSYPMKNGPFVNEQIKGYLIPKCLNDVNFKETAKEYVKRLVINEGIDIIINQCYPTWTADILSDLKGRVKIIECLHMTLFYPSSYHSLRWSGYDLKMRLCGPLVYNHFQKKWRCDALMREFPFVDRFVFLSSTYVNEFLKFTGYNNIEGKITFINNPLSLSANNLNDDVIYRKENIVVCVARLSEMEKRISYMLYVWKGIESDKRFDDWRFDIVGDGPSSEDYKRLSNNLGLKRVFFHGYQDPTPYYIKAKVSLMTSIAEGWGMTIVESQYYGVVPVVMNTFSSVHDIIQNGINGIIVPKSEKIFLRTLKNIMIGDQVRVDMAKAAMKSSKLFNVEIIVDKWEKLINEI